jgi:hypothetical protein
MAAILRYKKLIAVLVILLTIPLTITLMQRVQEVRQRAAEIALPNAPSAIHGVADIHSDSFEEIDFNKWSRSAIDPTNILEIIPGAAYTGTTNGLRAVTNENDSATLTKDITPTKEIYTRVWFKAIEKTPKKYMQDLFQLKTEEGARIFSYGIRQEPETIPLNFVYTTEGSNANRQTGKVLEKNRWYCIETRLIVNGANGHTSLWLDGEVLFNEKTNNGSIPVGQIVLGPKSEEKYTEYYYDEFAADNFNKIGCDPLVPDPGPQRSNVLPQEKQTAEITQTQLRVTTDVQATCKYSTNPDETFDQMTQSFSQTNSTQHTQSVTNLTTRIQYEYFVKCKDTSGKANTTNEKIAFYVPIERTISKPLELRATYHSMSVVAPYEGDDNKDNTATFRYRKVGTQNWIQGMEMTPDKREFVRGNKKLIPNDYNSQFRASILMAEPNTQYEVEVTFADNDSVEGTTQRKIWQTKSESFPESNQVRYVASPDFSHPAGSGDGTSQNPWRSVEFATMELRKGYFKTLLFKPGTYKERVYIDSDGSIDGSEYITIRPETPLTIAQMKNPAFANQKVVIDASEVQGTAERKELCGSGNSDKNLCAFILAGNYIRVSGFEIINGFKAVKVGGDPSSIDIHDVVFENNYIHDQTAFMLDKPGAAGGGIITIGDTFDGTNGVHDVTIQGNEIISKRDAMKGGNIQFNAAPKGGHVVRNNILIQTNYGNGQHGNDCIAGLPNFQSYGGYGRDVDIYNNYCEGATDEGIEIDGFNMNIRVWGNTIKRANLGFSITPVYYGPVYVFRNTYYDPQQYWVNSCIGVKSGVGGTGHAYFYHNTFYLSDLGLQNGGLPRCGGITLYAEGSGYSDETRVELDGGGGTGAIIVPRVKDGKISGLYVVNGGQGYTSAPTVRIVDPTGTGSGAGARMHLLQGSSNGLASNGDAPDAMNVTYYNNIIMGYDRTVNNFRQDNVPVMDFNLVSEEENTYRHLKEIQDFIVDDIFAKWKNDNYKTFDAFRTASGQEANGINAKAQFADVTKGDFRLKAGSPGINAGKPLIGFNDMNSYWVSNGVPDMGACELGASWTDQMTPCIGGIAVILPSPTATPTPTLPGQPTATPTPSYTPSPTIPGQPTATPTQPQVTPTPTGSGITTGLRLSVKLHGLGKGGDNVNPDSLGNMTPLTLQRPITVQVLNGAGTVIYSKDGKLEYRAITGTFSETMQTPLISGPYIVKIKTPKYLQNAFPGIITVTGGQTNDLPVIDLVAGDVNNDNILNISDYNLIRDCYSDLTLAIDCADETKKQSSDITDDGAVNQFDYNLFIRELSVRSGE